MKHLAISVDFDGCIVEDAFPSIGPTKPHAIRVIRKWLTEGHSVIINSCRCGDREKDVRLFLKINSLSLTFFQGQLLLNSNLTKRIDIYGSDTRKISADVYIDDKNIFCREINWLEIEKEIERLSEDES